MIPQRDLSWQTQSWQEQMMNSVKSASELLNMLDIDSMQVDLSEKAARGFPVLAPHSFISRMRAGDANDPILRQVLNSKNEEIIQPGYSADPLEETKYNPVKGLIRKYHNRALLIATGKCAVNCRYCFRREFPYQENNPSRDDWQTAFEYLKKHAEIEEVILSGGDPLAIPDRHLQWLVHSLSEIQTIKRLRIHTRFVVVIPDRITDDLIRTLDETRLQITVVVHSNHANEFNDSLVTAIERLKKCVDFVLNQSVLLRGINDNLDTQVDLQNACVDAGILPYYLHFLDPVRGASHFEVSRHEALSLYREMQSRLSGYMLPKLVVEAPGALSKQFLQ